MSDELALLEKLVGGTVGGALVLAVVSWQLWQRLATREAQTDALIREVLIGLSASTTAMLRTAEAVEALREAIDRGEHRSRRQAAAD